MSNGGLIGAVSRIKMPTVVYDPLLWIIRFVLAAGFILIAKKAAANPDMSDVALVGVLGSAALMTEYYMGGEIVRAWFDRAIARIFACFSVYIIALGYAALMWTGTASEMESSKSGLQKSAHIQATQAEASMKAAGEATAGQRKVVDALKVERWRPLPNVNGVAVGSAKEAQDVLNTLKGNTRFWTLTEGCTKSAGPNTREFVKQCGEAKAAITASEIRDQVAPTLAEAEKRLAQLEQAYVAALSTYTAAPKTTTSETRADLRFLTTYGGFSEQAAQDFSAAWKVMIISVLAFVLGMMLKAREYRDLPRKPWPFMVWIKRLIFGGPTAEDAIRDKLNRDGTVTFTDETKVNELKAKLASAFNGAKAA
jgi:hypothetical protein